MKNKIKKPYQRRKIMKTLTEEQVREIAREEIAAQLNTSGAKTASATTPLSDLPVGATFSKSGKEFIVLEHFDDGNTAVIAKESLKDKMSYGANNNFAGSNIRKFLNTDYLGKFEDDFGVENIVEHDIDLLSLDGLDDYGVDKAKVSLLTIDQYRKYRKILGANLGSWWWLATPDSTPSGYGAAYARCVDSRGRIDYCDCGFSGGVRPFCILKSTIFVS
jgi:hypothetical protein